MIRIIISFLVSTLIVFCVGVSVVDGVTSSTYGLSYTPEKWWNEEQAYCANKNATATEYIATRCSLFGCIDIQRTKCVTENREFQINYNTKEFCKLTMKGDLEKC